MKRKGFYQVFCTLVCLTAGAASYAASNGQAGDPAADAAGEGAHVIQDGRPVSPSIVQKFSNEVVNKNKPAACGSVNKTLARLAREGVRDLDLNGKYPRDTQRVMDYLKANLDKLEAAERAEAEAAEEALEQQDAGVEDADDEVEHQDA